MTDSSAKSGIISPKLERFDAKTLRDRFATSRKYAIAVLEHLDSVGVTQRVGDVRKRGRNL